MDSFIERLSELQQFLSKLSWKKIFQLFALLLIISVAWFTYAISDQLFTYIRTEKIQHVVSPTKQLSEATIEKITAATSRSDLVLGSGVTIFNFQKNIRYVIYLGANSYDLNADFSKYNHLLNAESPIFGQNEFYNRKIVDIINGDFICVPYENTPFSQEMPDSTQHAQTLCVHGMPPVFGKLTGTVMFFLKRPPTSAETDQLRIIARDLSTYIYDNELK